MALTSVMACVPATSAFQEGSSVFPPCSYSALCAPAIPSAARSKQLGVGDEGSRLAQVTLSVALVIMHVSVPLSLPLSPADTFWICLFDSSVLSWNPFSSRE